MAHASFCLVESCSGTGELSREPHAIGPVQYRLDRYQGMLEGSGMPIPGLQRIEGTVTAEGADLPSDLVGASLTLRLEDGRSVAVTLADDHGRILAEGHGPGRGCMCC
jgi:hypothetical protein